jgi:hypothetical protein
MFILESSLCKLLYSTGSFNVNDGKYLFMDCSYLLILDRTNWKTNIFTSLLIPYIFFSLPSLIFSIFRWLAFCTLLLSSSYHSLFSNTKFSVFYFGNISCHLFSSLHREDIGRWIAFIAVVLRLFVPRHFPGMIHVIIVCVLSTYLLSLLLYIYTLLSSNCPIITSKLYR